MGTGPLAWQSKIVCPTPCLAGWLRSLATQYEMPWKPSMTTFQMSIIAMTPGMASHKARHPSCNFSVFMITTRRKAKMSAVI